MATATTSKTRAAAAKKTVDDTAETEKTAVAKTPAVKKAAAAAPSAARRLNDDIFGFPPVGSWVGDLVLLLSVAAPHQYQAHGAGDSYDCYATHGKCSGGV